MRLLRQRHDHDRGRAAQAHATSERAGRAHRARQQSLPLRHPQSHRARSAARRPGEREDLIMHAFTRRDFAAGLGGIVLSFSLAPRLALAQEPPRLPGSLQTNRRLDAWLRINSDGTATVLTGKVELGQGILTALRQIAAEELDLPLDRIAMIS